MNLLHDINRKGRVRIYVLLRSSMITLLFFGSLKIFGKQEPSNAPDSATEAPPKITKACCTLPPSKSGLIVLQDSSNSSIKSASSNQAPAPNEHEKTPAPPGMLWIPSAKFAMGTDDEQFTDARPIHTVALSSFWIDETPVTNRQYAEFVSSTRYVTTAERSPDPKDFPGVPKEFLVPGSLVFTSPPGPVPLDDYSAWWKYQPGASWKHPEGPGSDISTRSDHPVVQVSWDDAAAYAKWSEKRLPTEAEWEYASRGGLNQKPFAWGDTIKPDRKPMANIWQGTFPNRNLVEDGFERTSPIRSFPANGFGLYDMSGNVWQWCADWYRPDAYATSNEHDPVGPRDSHDPLEPGVPKRVQRGGSFLCCDQFCAKYRAGARGKGAVDSGASHIGFRCAKSP